MSIWVWVSVAVVVAVLLVAALWVSAARRRERLRERFGPEYDRTVEQEGERQAQRELAERERAREQLEIGPLTEAARSRYLQQWEAAQTRFVDDPRGAATDADRIVRAVLSERGYPVVADLEQRVAPLSVDYPEAVDRYRHGHGLLDATNGDRGDEDGVTEGLREAMLDFRTVFEALVERERTSV